MPRNVASHERVVTDMVCSPGRFFVAHELKMVLAYFLNNYEIKPISERPKPQWLGQNIIPPLQAKIEVRRRNGTV
jgi:hypothetical protein